MASADDVQLPDLQVIQRYSLAVRAGSAPRADVVAALQADLAWLTGTGRRRATVTEPTDGTAPAGTRATAPARKAAAKRALAKKSVARRA